MQSDVQALLNTPKAGQPDQWHKEPWMLLVVGAPLIVVVAAIATGIIAWKSQDKVLSADYYRQGLQIDQDLQKDANARTYNMESEISVLPGNVLEMQLRGAAKQPPVALLVIATGSSGLAENEAQYKIAMQQVRPGLYRASVPAGLIRDEKIWHVKLAADDWRLTARWQHHANSTLQMQAAR